ncbi:unnamed protein product [Echinostoma caproni]|uniref:Nucleotid_trans domain-containing protein n=1 Tax=Echinostoma caproni TaxID=27848 RepID=A0A183B262_9TREM|nr:unnamed protein product [Echinostoma caproni]
METKPTVLTLTEITGMSIYAGQKRVEDLQTVFNGQLAVLDATAGIALINYSLKPQIDWIPNKHRAGIYAMLRLIITDILPSSVEKVIVLDTDTLFNYNILDLWKQFEKFTPQQIVGVNGGVLLLHLKKMRHNMWSTLWLSELFYAISRQGTLYNGEQDVFVFMIIHNPQIYYRLPCEWNFQLSRFSLPHCCPVIWPLRRPDEMDCITGKHSPASATQPNLLKIGHLDRNEKPETNDYTQLAESDDLTTVPSFSSK